MVSLPGMLPSWQWISLSPRCSSLVAASTTLPLVAFTPPQRVEQEVGQREVTVRELFRSASLLAANKPVVYRNANRLPPSSSLPKPPVKETKNADAVV